MLGIALPEEFGGGGKGLLELAIAVEGVAEGGGGMEAGSLFLAGPVFGGCLLERHGTQAQKEAYLPGLASGQMCAGAFTEPESGSNITAIKTRAELRGDRYVINGQKVYISLVQQSQRIVVMARTQPYDPEHRTRGISLLLGELPSDAVRTAPFKKLGNHFMDTNRVYFSDYEVPAENVVGEEGRLGPALTTCSTLAESSSAPRPLAPGSSASGAPSSTRGAEPWASRSARIRASSPARPARIHLEGRGSRSTRRRGSTTRAATSESRGHGQYAAAMPRSTPRTRRSSCTEARVLVDSASTPLAESSPLPGHAQVSDEMTLNSSRSRISACGARMTACRNDACLVQALGEGARPGRPVPRPGEGEALVRISGLGGGHHDLGIVAHAPAPARAVHPGWRARLVAALGDGSTRAAPAVRDRRLATRGKRTARGLSTSSSRLGARPVPEARPRRRGRLRTVSAAAWAAFERWPRAGRKPSASPARRARTIARAATCRAARRDTCRRLDALAADLPGGVEVCGDEGPAEPVDALVDTVGGELLPRRLRSMRPDGARPSETAGDNVYRAAGAMVDDVDLLPLDMMRRRCPRSRARAPRRLRGRKARAGDGCGRPRGARRCDRAAARGPGEGPRRAALASRGLRPSPARPSA